MCKNHELKVLRTFGIELEGYTTCNIRGNYVKGWKLINDGSLEDNGQETCEYCNGEGTREIECGYCYGSGNIECDDCCGNGEVPCGYCNCDGWVYCKECKGEGGQWDDNDNWVACEHCEDGKIDCDECEGSGYIECENCEGSGNVRCDECSGEGCWQDECDECYGRGYWGDEEGGFGVECVSDILEEGDTESIDRIFNYIERENWCVNDDCGTHVHVGADDLSACDMSKLYALMNIVEPMIYGTLPSNRMGHYSKPTIRNKVTNFMRQGMGIELQDVANVYYEYHVNLNGSFGRYDSERYYGLNLHSYFYRRHKNGSPTIEFRYFEGCDDKEKAIAWIDLCIKLVDFAKYVSFEQLLIIGKEFYLVDNLKEYIAKVKDLLGLEYNFKPYSTYAFEESKRNVASVFRDTSSIERAV